MLKRICYAFSLWREHKSPRRQKIMWLHRWFSLTISPLPPIFGGNRPCQRGDIKFSICHVNSCNEKVIWHYEWVSLIISPYSTKFGDHQPWRGGDTLFLTCHVTSYYIWSEDHLILRVSSPQYKSSSCQYWWTQVLCNRKKFVFRLSRDLPWLCGRRVMWHCKWVLSPHQYLPPCTFYLKFCYLSPGSFISSCNAACYI